MNWSELGDSGRRRLNSLAAVVTEASPRCSSKAKFGRFVPSAKPASQRARPRAPSLGLSKTSRLMRVRARRRSCERFAGARELRWRPRRSGGGGGGCGASLAFPFPFPVASGRASCGPGKRASWRRGSSSSGRRAASSYERRHKDKCEGCVQQACFSLHSSRHWLAGWLAGVSTRVHQPASWWKRHALGPKRARSERGERGGRTRVSRRQH